MTPASPVAPPASGPQEATPAGALAALLRRESDGIDTDGLGPLEGAYQRGRITSLDFAAGLVTSQLAPAWDALAGENERLREARARVAAIADRWGAIGGDLGTCARQLREALEAPDA